MAITINGSGSITGLSAGGLPDGCVTNDDLAGSIADGKITGLSSSKLSGALPAISGASLTNLDARDLENALPAISGASLTGITTGFTQGTEQATTSGTSFTFGSIPAGTQMIIVNFVGCSQTGAGKINVRLGDSGGIESSGYTEASLRIHGTSLAQGSTGNNNFGINTNDSPDIFHGHMILTLEDATNFTWCESHVGYGASNKSEIGGGSKSLSAELTQVQVAGGTFDAGAINIMYI